MDRQYPAVFDVVPPVRFERAHLALRVLLLLLLGLVGMSLGWVMLFLYLALPTYAAIVISQSGSDSYLRNQAPRVAQLLRWVLSGLAYLTLLVDQVPTGRPETAVRFEVAPQGSPTVGSALLRLLTSLPEALVLALLGIVWWVVWIIAAVMVLVTNHYPRPLYELQRGLLRWVARLAAYHASLVDVYPPLAIDTGPEPAAPMG